MDCHVRAHWFAEYDGQVYGPTSLCATRMQSKKNTHIGMRFKKVSLFKNKLPFHKLSKQTMIFFIHDSPCHAWGMCRDSRHINIYKLHAIVKVYLAA